MIGLVTALAAFAGVEVDTLVARLKRDAIALAAVAFCVLVAIVFLLVALHAALAGSVGPVAAALIIAAVALIVALIVYLTSQAAHGAAARRAEERRRAQEKAALVTAVAGAALPLVLQSRLLRRIGLPVGGLLAAAYLLARSDTDGAGDDDATNS